MTVAAEPSGTQTNVLRSPRGRGGGLRACLAGLAAAGGMLLGILAFPQAALAQGDFNAWVSQGHDPQLDIGGATATVTVDVLATFPPGHGPKDAEIKGSLSGLDGMAFVGVGGVCEASGDSSVKCSRMTSGETRQVQFIVTTQAEADLPQGESRTGQLNIEFPGGTTQTSVTVRGTASAGISEISGTVTSNAQPVPDAKLELTDGEGEDHETTTDGDGNYTFTGSGSDPIAPGEMTLVITAEGFQDKEDTFEVSEGSGSYKRNVTLAAEEVAEPTSAAPTPEASPTPAAASEDPPEGNGISGTLIFLIVIGALLVVGGIIGIIFLLRGSKDGDKDDGESFAPDGPPDHQPTAAQVGTPGVYQAGPAPGSDAPTMIHPGGLVDSGAAAPTQFGPAYGGGSDSTQVMPQGGFGAAPGAPGMPGGQVGPDGTTILPVVKQPGGPSASDATQIMPQANLGAKPPASAPPSPYADPAATRPHPGPSASPSPYSDADPAFGSHTSPGATRPHPGPSSSPSPYGDLGSTRPHPAPTPPPASGSMFEPQNQGIAPSAPPQSSFGSQGAAPSVPPVQSYGAPGSPSAPPEQGYGAPGSQGAQPEQSYGPQSSHGASPSASQYGAGSQGYGAPGGQPSQPAQPSRPGQGYGSHGGPPSAPASGPPNGDAYPSQSMRRDPYAPPEQPPPPTGEFGATRAMPQYGADQAQPPAAPYGGEPNGEGEDPDSGRADRRGWGEWDDRPRSW